METKRRFCFCPVSIVLQDEFDFATVPDTGISGSFAMAFQGQASGNEEFCLHALG